MCPTYLGYFDGVICKFSQTLLKYLEGIKEFYKKHVLHTANDYNSFEDAFGVHSNASGSGAAVQSAAGAVNFHVREQPSCLKKYTVSG
jgi:hypothetical protein